jgi:nucleotide-binding universal stress UspA family protein
LFEKILVPLPSEYFPEHAVKRGIQLASKYNAKLYLNYIVEKNVIDKIKDVSSGALSQCSIKEMTNKIKHEEFSGESSVIFDRVEQEAQYKNIEVRKLIQEGNMSDEILDCIETEEIDLIITEFHKDTVLKYRILYNSPIPIWLEHNGLKMDKIYGILTNLSPNKKVPSFTFDLGQALDLPVQFYYVLDTSQDYDPSTEEHEREKLLKLVQSKSKKLGIEAKIDIVTNDISSFMNQMFKHNNEALVVLGRFKKEDKIPFSSKDKKIEVSKKLGANVLMLK